MFIHKIFHLHQPLEDARKRVTELGVLRELELDRASFIGDGVGHFEVKTRLGGRLSADIRMLPESEPEPHSLPVRLRQRRASRAWWSSSRFART